MSTLFVYAAKMLALSMLFTGYYWLFLRNRNMHVFNRFYLLLSVVAAITIPLVNFDLYSYTPATDTLSYKLVHAAGPREVETVGGAATTGSFSWWTLAAWLYFLPTLVFIVRTLVQVYRLGLLRHNAVTIQRPGYSIVTVDQAGGPFSFFRTIYWCGDVGYDSNERKAIIAHELVHIRQWHTADKLFTQAASALFWFNPLFHLVNKELSMTHEFIADKAMEHNNQGALAQLILHAYFGKQLPTIVNPFFQSPIKRRITMVNNTQKPRMARLRQLLVIPAAMALVGTLSFTVNKPAANVDVVRAKKKMTIVVDAGHGGKDNGAVSLIGVNEKDLTLEIAKQLQALAAEHNIEVTLTRPDDNYVALEQRAAIYNNMRADVFLSIHVAVADDKDPHSKEIGLCVSPRGKQYYESKVLANRLGARIWKAQEHPYMFEKGIHVLRENQHPAVLVECSNIENSQLRDKAYVTAICHSLLNGIADYGNEH